jgi:hypothetical protein
MKFPRAIVEKKPRRDRIINTHITEQLRMEEIQNQIERSRLRWFGHVKKWMSVEYQKDY